MTLDRINSFGNYEPSNCQWATLTEQNANKRGLVALALLARMGISLEKAVEDETIGRSWSMC